MTRVLEHRLAVVAGERHDERERPRPDLWIVERHLPLQRVGTDWCEAFSERELLAVVPVVVTEVCAVREVRRFDDQRVALPVRACITHIQSNCRRELRSVVAPRLRSGRP